MPSLRDRVVDRQQALKIADALESLHKDKLHAMRDKRARLPSFWYGVQGLRKLPAHVQEELLDQAKWLTIRNWRFILAFVTALLLEVVILWYFFRQIDWTVFAVMVPVLSALPISALLALPAVRAELRRLVGQYSNSERRDVD